METARTAESMHSVIYYYNEPIPGREERNLPAVFLPERRDAGNKNRTATETQETIKTADQTGKEVDIMKGLEIAIIIIGCGMKILEVLEEC